MQERKGQRQKKHLEAAKLENQEILQIFLLLLCQKTKLHLKFTYKSEFGDTHVFCRNLRIQNILVHNPVCKNLVNTSIL